MAVRRKTSREKKPPRTRLEVDERRAQLLSLGLRVFSTSPYDQVSLDAIASEAGVSKGLLLHYFSSKRDYYLACLREAARDLLARTDTSAELPPLERLRRGINAYLDYVSARGPAYLALMRGGVGSDPAVAAIVDETRQELVRRLTESAPLGVPMPALVRASLRGWVGFAETASLHWLEHRDFPRDQLIALLVAMLEHAVSTALSGTAAASHGVE